jgi:hypothetical protein
MAFRDFVYPKVLDKLHLTCQEVDLSSGSSPLSVREEFATFFQEGLAIAVGSLGVCSEKAKSEFIIAPLLVELRRLMGRQFSVFSGMELNVNKARGLNGECDHILTKGSNQHLRDAPIVAVLEAKNEDYSQQGLGQCIAAMFAAQMRNEKDGRSVRRVFGAVTTGRAWRFLQLEGNVILMDWAQYGVQDLGKLLGILKYRIECALNPAPDAVRAAARTAKPVFSGPLS